MGELLRGRSRGSTGSLSDLAATGKLPFLEREKSWKQRG